MPKNIPELSLDEIKCLVGVRREGIVSPPIAASDIRKHAIAVYWPATPPRLFWDEAYASQTPWRGIIAPPDFNPFAWPITGPGRLPTQPGFVAGAKGLNGGSEVAYGVPMRPGDVITATDGLIDVYERHGRSGRLVFVVGETVWHNQRGEWVKTLRNAGVNILPEGGLA